MARTDAPVAEAAATGTENCSQLKRRVLLPLAVVLALLLAVFCAALYRSNNNHLTESFGVELRTMQFYYQDMVRLRSAKLEAALQLLGQDAKLAAALESGRRDVLTREFAPLYERLRRESGVSHFYFLDPQRAVILRLHQPSRFGDRIQGTVESMAEREGRIATGLEIGKVGTFTLRAVVPIRRSGRLVGYVELGEEAADMVRELGRAFGCQAFVLLYKSRLSREGWEDGMRMLGRASDWDRFPAEVVAAGAEQPMPAGLASILQAGGHVHLSPEIGIDEGERYFRAGFIPLLDAGRRDVGDLVVLRDATTAVAQTRHEAYWVGAVTAVAGLLLFAFFYLLLRRTETALAASKRRAIDEAEARASLQRQHVEELTTWIREREQAQEALRIAAIAFEAQEAMMVTDVEGVILRVNQAFSELTGYDAEEVVGRSPAILKSGRHDAEFYRTMWHALSRDGYWEGEIWNRRKNGEVFPEWQTISAVTGADGRVSHYVASFSDLSGSKEAERRIYYLAFFDSLTQLPNRRLLLDRIAHALVTSNRSGRHGALLFIDLDNFKSLNETQGHEVGDQLLKAVAGRLQGCLRAEDTVARLGGDEFMVVLEGLCEDAENAAGQAEAVASKIVAALGETYVLNGRSYYSTPSIGVTVFCGMELTVEELMKRADVALYQAKDAGRNAIRFFAPAIQMALEARQALEAELRRALPQEQFRLYYQPQVDRAGRIFGAEALIRWQHPERGLVPPGQFIPLAEETGLIVAIGQWVLEAACAELAAWQGSPATRELQLAINVSARQFRLADFVDRVRTALEHSGVTPARLKLELTETIVLDDIEDTIRKMRALKALGVGFSVDDFGTGYSSLAYLKQLPLDQLKIDRSFVRDLVSDPNDAAIVRAIIGLAKSLGLMVVAEGVETEAQCTFLHIHDCHAFQGYLISQPVPAAQFRQMVEERLAAPTGAAAVPAMLLASAAG